MMSISVVFSVLIILEDRKLCGIINRIDFEEDASEEKAIGIEIDEEKKLVAPPCSDYLSSASGSSHKDKISTENGSRADKIA